MTQAEEGIELFIEALSDSLGVTPPSVRFDTPISTDAQYSQVRTQIQYYDDAEMLKSLSDGGAAPLRWTLHEFAHHVLHEENKQQQEAFCRWFADDFTADLIDAWRTAIRDGAKPTIVLNEETIASKISDIDDA